MRINHNISAQWANTNLKRADRRMSSALQSLSSGYKINKAADDSVGLAISNKMRAQIRSLDQASRNADDGESIIQTVDGSLAEIQKVVQRLRELSVQAASDTYVIDDRDSMQKEMNSLMDEIDRIASTTEFNGKGLLDGSSSRATTSTNYIFSVVSVSEQVKAADYDIELTGQASNATASIEYTIPADGKSTIEINGVSIEIESTDTSDDVKEKVLAVCNKMEIDVSTGNAANSFNLATKAAGSLQSITYRSFNDTEMHVTRGTDAQVKLTDRNGNILTDGIAYHGNGELVTISDNSGFEMKVRINPAGAVGQTSELHVYDGGSMQLQIGANEHQDIRIDFPELSCLTLGLREADGDNMANVCSQQGASNAITVFSDASAQISAYRSRLGAYENRLETTVSSLDVSSENMTDSMSRIMDTDMAVAMTEYTQSSVLSQAATSMLAQANNRPQQIMSLLQG